MIDPKLNPAWKTILVKAWSIRFTVLAAILSGLEVGFALINPDAFGIPQGTFAGGAALCSAAAFIARIVAQKGLTK